MGVRVVVCPLCRSEQVDIVTDSPAIVLCKCRACATSFIITPPLTTPTALG
jgi:hypothetical protein